MRTVRDATFDVLRRLGLTTVFANPGSTEVALLAGLPDDFEFIMGLHESSVVGLATGLAIARDRPALVILHTTAGLGNAVGALATARVNRAPLVVIVGQQDRRHLALEPFLTGELGGLAGTYPVWVGNPVRAVDVPGAIVRASHEAVTGRGPALVIVAMDDWSVPFDDDILVGARQLRRPAGPDDGELTELVDLLERASAPVMVVGARADDAPSWAATVALSERLRCPVWQEPFGARAGFPQDHPHFAGHLPAGRAAQRAALAGHDLVLVVGAPVFRQYAYEPGAMTGPGTVVALVTDDPAEAHRSPVDLALLASPARVCARLAELVTARPGAPPRVSRADPPRPPRRGQPLRPAHVLRALAQRLPPDAVVVEEAPSARPDLHDLVPARAPLGYVSAAMGGLGFALPAAAGLRMGLPTRPVVAVVGDGSAFFAIQALWSAARYGCGVLYLVLANGHYATLDQLAERRGLGKPPWPRFDEVRVGDLARALGCAVRTISSYAELLAALDEVLPDLAARTAPLLLDVAVITERGADPSGVVRRSSRRRPPGHSPS